MLLPKLRAYRELEGHTQVSLSKKAGVGVVSVIRAEGGHNVSPRLAKKLADALGLEIVDLVDEEAIPLDIREGATRRVIKDVTLQWRVLEDAVEALRQEPEAVSHYLRDRLSEEERERLVEKLLDKEAV